MIHLKKQWEHSPFSQFPATHLVYPRLYFCHVLLGGRAWTIPPNSEKNSSQKSFVRDICGLSKLAPCKWTPLRLLANNSQHCWMLHVVCINCTPCCMLLGVVAQSLKSVKLLATWKRMQQTPNIVGPTINGGIKFSQLCPFARTVKPVLSGHPLLIIKRTLAEVPLLISLIYFKWNLYY